jgi:hypothetical protein
MHTLGLGQAGQDRVDADAIPLAEPREAFGEVRHRGVHGSANQEFRIRRARGAADRGSGGAEHRHGLGELVRLVGEALGGGRGLSPADSAEVAARHNITRQCHNADVAHDAARFIILISSRAPATVSPRARFSQQRDVT